MPYEIQPQALSTANFRLTNPPESFSMPDSVHRATSDSTIFAFLVIAVVDVIFVACSDQFRHWFVLPVSMCGILIGADAIDWFRGRLGTFDPAGLIGVLGFHFFYLAPLLHVFWGYWIADVAPPPDWRRWLGFMAILNVVGLAFYQIARRLLPSHKPPTMVWHVDKQIFNWFVPLCVAVSLCAQVWVYRQFGGITGYMQARMNSPRAFEGMGWIFMISESAPLLTAFFLIVHVKNRGNVSWHNITAALAALFAFQMIFGGLRGSRSETVLLLFWVVGCIHLMIRPVPRKLIFLGCAFIALFLYLYGFYKNMGTEASQVLSASSDERNEMAETTGRTWKMLVLDDLGRCDVQAFILFRLKNDASDFTYANGRTYLASLSLLIPHWMLPERPETVEREGTEIQTGPGGYFRNISWSSRVYGLAGESMLNYGLLSVPVVYGLFGLFLAWFRRFSQTLAQHDTRLLLIPFGVYMCVTVVSADSDNLIYGLAKNGLMPILVVLVCSTRISLSKYKMNRPPVVPVGRRAPA
jgi:hypothetical protein